MRRGRTAAGAEKPVRLIGGVVLACLLLALALAPAPARAEECPNAQLRYEDGSLSLPDCRAYEMVSPVEKNGGAVARFGAIAGGGVLQAAASGEAATFSSSASFGAGAAGAPVASQYISRRGGAGWATENVTGPTLSGDYGEAPEGVPFQLFSEGLERGLLLDGRRCGEAEPCPREYSLRDSAGGVLTPLSGTGGMRVVSASADLGRIVFEGEGGYYEWSGGGLVPIAPPPPGMGVLGESADGQTVYYQDGTGLFVSREGVVSEIAAGAEAAQPSDYPPGAGTARVSPDGQTLAFLSKAELTGYDNRDAATGEPDSEVFLWSAAGGLRCASCNTRGERPLGPSTIPGAVANGAGPDATRVYKPRDLTDEGTRLFFDSLDRVVPGDGSAAQDVYEWEAPGAGSCAAGGRGYFAAVAGCVFLLSSGSSAEASEFADASSDGRDAFFLTGASLSATDPGSVDLYDAREGGGFPLPEAQIPCDGDACQAVPNPPLDPLPGTLVAGQGNPPPHFPPLRCGKGRRRGASKQSKFDSSAQRAKRSQLSGRVKRKGKTRCVGRHSRTKRGRR